MEQLVLLIVIGLISLINWLLQRAAEARERRKTEGLSGPSGRGTGTPASPPAPAEEDPAESMRKLMEALGLPVEDEPPPIRRAPTPPPLPTPAPPPPAPALGETGEELAGEFAMPPVPREPAPAERAAGAFPAPPPDPAPPPPPSAHPTAASAGMPRPARELPRSRFRELLSSPPGLRDAVLLSEILGRPRGLQS